MKRKQHKQFLSGMAAPNAAPRADLAIFDHKPERTNGFHLRIDSVDGQVRGLFWQEGKMIVLGSIDDLISLYELLIPNRPTDAAATESFDRLLLKIQTAIENASLAKVSPQMMPN